MALDLSEFFKKYEAIIGESDQVFNAVRTKYAENVRCEKGCCDCCHALFDLTLVEALFLNTVFGARFTGKDRTRILKRADEADRQVHRLKRDAFRAVKDGQNAQEILLEMAKVRVRCPLLDDGGLCEMYDARPVTCRIYGVPTAIGGEAHTCGKSAFEKGQAYPTVYLDRIQDRLYALSHELAGSLNTQYKELGEVLVPVSLALLTEYTEEYLGIKKPGDASAAATTAGKAPAAPAEASPETPAPGAGARPRTPAQAPRGKALGGKVSAGATTAGKGLAECAGCSPEAKQGGCAGCAPKSFTIGQAPEKPVKKPAAKAVAKPAAKAPEKTPAKKSAKPTGKG